MRTNFLTSTGSRLINHSVVLFGVFFTLLVCLRHDVLFYPPYWDSIVGPFAEAIWLANNGFDFVRLAYEVPGYGWGGPRTYFFSWYPSFQAILLRVFPDTSWFLLTNHLLSFGYAATALVAFYRLLRHRFEIGASLLGCGLLMAHPLFITQADAINMEMPVLAGTLVAMALTVQQRSMPGAVVALLVMAVKPTAVIGVAALLLFSIATGESRWKIRWGVRSLLCFGMGTALLQWWLRQAFHLERNDMIVALLQGSLKSILLTLPDFLGLYLVAGFYCGMMALAYIGTIRLLRYDFNQRERVDLLFSTFFICFTVFYINIVNILPRYLLYCLPALLYCLMMMFHYILKKPNRVIVAIVLTALIFLGNMHGRFYTPAPGNNGFILERSLEYLDDMRLNMKLAGRLEAQYRDVTIVTSQPFIQMLVLPELGYVTAPLDAVTIDGPLLYGPASSSFRSSGGADKVWVHAPNAFSSRYGYYAEEDQLIETVSYGKRQAFIFHNIE